MTSKRPARYLIISAMALAACRVDELDESGRTPLMVAAERGDTASVRRLLAEGAYVNAEVPSRKIEELMVDIASLPELPKSDRGFTPLMYAALGGNPHAVRILIDAGADVNHKTGTGHTALGLALRQSDLPIARLLTAAGARPEQSQFAYAVAKQSPEMVRLLASRGGNAQGKAPADPQAGRPWPIPLVIAATIRGDPEVVRALLDAGANPNARDPNGWTPLRWARDSEARIARAPEVTAVLAAAGARDDAGDKDAALFKAVNGGNAARVREALRLGANPNARDSHGSTALITAAHHGSADVVALLTKSGAYVDFAPRFSATPLTAAIDNGSVATVKALLAAGADPNRRDGVGWSPMFVATLRSRPDIVVLLLANSAKAEWNTLAFAAGRGDSVTVRLLLERGANPERALRGAVYGCRSRDNTAVILALLERGAKPASGDYFVVPRAAAICGAAALQALLAHGGDPNERDYSGDTPLIIAAKSGKLENIGVLMRAGANPKLKGRDGLTADVVGNRHPEIQREILRLRDSIRGASR